MFFVGSSTYGEVDEIFRLLKTGYVGVFTTKEKAVDGAVKALQAVVTEIEDIDSCKELLNKTNYYSIALDGDLKETYEDIDFIIELRIVECELDKPIT